MNLRETLISKPVDNLKQQRIFRDRLFQGFVATAIILCLATVLILLIRVRPKDFVVPLEYSSLQGFDTLGAWYKVYAYGLFSIIITAGNITLAVLSFEKSRIASFFLVLGAIFINLFVVVITLTLTAQLDV